MLTLTYMANTTQFSLHSGWSYGRKSLASVFRMDHKSFLLSFIEKMFLIRFHSIDRTLIILFQRTKKCFLFFHKRLAIKGLQKTCYLILESGQKMLIIILHGKETCLFCSFHTICSVHEIVWNSIESVFTKSVFASGKRKQGKLVPVLDTWEQLKQQKKFRTEKCLSYNII